MTTSSSGRLRDRLPHRLPRSLSERVRRLFALFTGVSGLLWALQLVVGDAGGDRRWAATAVALALTGWAVLQYRRTLAGPLRDALAIATLAGMVAWFPHVGWVSGATFLILFQRTLDSTALGAWLWTGITFASFRVAVVGEPDVAGPLSLASATTLVGYALSAYIMRTLATTTRAHERAAQREAALAVCAHRLLTTSRETEVLDVACETACNLVVGADRSASVWRARDDGGFTLVSTTGPLVPSYSSVDAGELPRRVVDALAGGEPVIADSDLVAALHRRRMVAGTLRTVVLVPVVSGRLAAVIAVAGSAGPDDDLLDVLGRFASELSLAWDRVELLSELAAANDELRRSDELKNHFVSMVSHELRTPLTAISGFAETLRDQWDRLEDHRRLHFIGVISRQALRQRRLVDDVLTMTRVVAGGLEVRTEPVSLATVVTAAAELVDAPVDVAVADDLAVSADPAHVEQVLTNLLVNARKYGAPPFEVHGHRDGPDVALAVVDHGAGVDPQFVDRLFDPFAQHDAGDRRTASGVGLGLAICRELLRANGGSIRHRRTPGGGATFVVRLPAASWPPPPAGGDPTAGARRTTRTSS